MDIQKKALQIIYDITGIVIKWDKQQLSDKDAMREIVKTLASEVENDKNFYSENKKSNSLLLKKKILAPLAISMVFIAVFFGINPVVFDEESIITENSKIGFEQQNDVPLIDQTPKEIIIEEFSNRTISKQD